MTDDDDELRLRVQGLATKLIAALKECHGRAIFPEINNINEFMESLESLEANEFVTYQE